MSSFKKETIIIFLGEKYKYIIKNLKYNNYNLLFIKNFIIFLF
jgi:hypothetical protein